MQRRTKAAALMLVVPLAFLGACSSGGDEADGNGDTVTLDYVLWDSLQQPAYEQCAADFTEKNPTIKVNIEQYGWADYWTNLQTEFVSDSGPDVFTDHVSWFPQFASQNQLLDLSDRIKQDGLDMGIYQESVADVWQGENGERYGLPKDWDTVALFYNTDMVTEAGFTEEDMQNLSWNPTDGGTYEQLVAAMTVDTNGVRGNEPGFDKSSIAVYGLGQNNNSGGAFGQVEYASYALSNDWYYVDKNPWGSEFYYSDAKLKETLGWYRGLIEKGYMPTLEIANSSDGMLSPFGAGKYAMVTMGSWEANSYASLPDISVKFAPTPIGPSGERASMFNGLADSIWSGTDHPDEAWELVKYLGSAACQDVVASHAVVFPAVKTSTDIAMKAFEDKGMDMSAFYLQVEDGTTYLPPIADHWGDVGTIMTTATDEVMSFQSGLEALDKANDEVNALFKE